MHHNSNQFLTYLTAVFLSNVGRGRNSEFSICYDDVCACVIRRKSRSLLERIWK